MMEFEKKNTIIEEKAMAFAVKVVNLKKQLNSQKREYNMADQIQRSGSAIGALYGENDINPRKISYLLPLNSYLIR